MLCESTNGMSAIWSTDCGMATDAVLADPNQALQLYGKRAAVERTRIEYLEKEKDWERNKSLFDKSLIARQELERFENLYHIAHNALKQAPLALEILEMEMAEASTEGTPDNANREDRKLSRGLYNQICLYPDKGGYEAPYVDYLLYTGHEVPADKVDEFNDWYNNKRIPEVAKLPGFVAARRLIYDDESDHLKIVLHDVTTPRYVTLYDFDSTKAFESGAFTKPSEPAGVTRTACQLYERFYPYKGFKYTPTLV